MRNIVISTSLAAFLLGVSATGHAEGLNIGAPIEACARQETKNAVSDYYAGRPGAPLAIPSRMLEAPELLVATALPEEARVAAAVTPQEVKTIWTSIDEWGAKAAVRLVFTMGGGQVMDFPSLIPMRQEDLNDGWLDIYADNGDGVHGHLWLDRVATAHAVDIPGAGGDRTRTISFYSQEGHLILGVYASMVGDEADPNAVNGFKKTQKIIAAMPQLCP